MCNEAGASSTPTPPHASSSPAASRSTAAACASYRPSAPPELLAAAEATDDLSSACRRDAAEPDTFQLFKRYFEFSMQRHTLFILRRLTKELARKEVETWKKAIRVLSHEVNNSLAPVSLAGALGAPDARQPRPRPAPARRSRHHRGARRASADVPRRLREIAPSSPSPRSAPWVGRAAGRRRGLYPFKVVGASRAPAPIVDPAQLQQVLINLLKNASESGSPAEEICHRYARRRGRRRAVGHRPGQGDDRGGPAERAPAVLLDEEVRQRPGPGAVPRRSVDAHGGRLSLHPREGGGTAVRCWLPRRRPHGVKRRTLTLALFPADRGEGRRRRNPYARGRGSVARGS